MGKKDLNNLVSNILSSPEPVKVSAPSPAPASPRTSSSAAVDDDEKVTFCGRASNVKLGKIRKVATDRNIPIVDLYNLAFGMFIEQYEAKYGTIEFIEEKKEKGDASSLL